VLSRSNSKVALKQAKSFFTDKKHHVPYYFFHCSRTKILLAVFLSAKDILFKKKFPNKACKACQY